jgi:hypothetical protein
LRSGFELSLLFRDFFAAKAKPCRKTSAQDLKRAARLNT